MDDHQHILDDTILVRTGRGQREALEDPGRLDAGEHRLLLLVNGFTPLGAFGLAEADRLARTLLAADLVATVPAPADVPVADGAVDAPGEARQATPNPAPDVP